MARTKLVLSIAAVPVLPVLVIYAIKFMLLSLGWYLRSTTKERAKGLRIQVQRDTKVLADRQDVFQEAEEGWEKIENAGTAPNGKVLQHDWAGIVGFFHPFCNAGGGGERVLWAAIAATQRRWPNAICAVYTGDHEIDKKAMIARVKDRFGITLQQQSLQFIYLSTRHFVLASTYPRFTLLGQSLGSLILAYDAFHLLVPDIFIDTMGYAFASALCKYLFPSVPTAAYVHYPTISTDMLDQLDDHTPGKSIHSGAGVGWKGWAKKKYWTAFAWLYHWVGKQIDVVMCNSSWTRGHILDLWYKKDAKSSFATVVYPPCPVEELEAKIDVSLAGEKRRQNLLLYIAQFRPEKNHSLILRAFAKYYHATKDNAKLVLIGSVRSNTTDDRHVYNLRLEARELKINEATNFICDAPFTLIQDYLQKASVTVNGMYSEHFGIGNVEGLAAGLIPVVHNSGGPKLDIVVPYEGQPIGYLADTEDAYASAFREIAEMNDNEKFAMRSRGRKSVKRFTEEAFASKWIDEMEKLIKMQMKWNK